MDHDTILQSLKFLTAAAVSFGTFCAALQMYLRGRKKLEHGLLDKQRMIEEQRLKTRAEQEAVVTTQLSLLRDSVTGLSLEVRRGREIQTSQERDIETLSKIVKDLRDAVGALSNQIRKYIESMVDSTSKRTIVREKKGP